MSDVYEYSGVVDSVSTKTADKLAKITLQRFNEAIRWQSQERVGDKSLKTVLRQCYDQFNGRLSRVDKEIADEIGVDAYVNLTAMKAGIVQAYLLESLIPGSSLPWTIQPTPQPDLSEAGVEEVIMQLRNEVEQNDYRGDLTELAMNLKAVTMQRELEHAKRAAENMEQLITDQCMEGGWDNALFGFITDFTVYPFAVMQGPIPVKRPRLQWVRNSLKPKVETYYTFNSVSPWDFWYSPDSPDTQRGTGVFIRQRWTKQQLLQAAQMPSFRRQAIIEILKDINEDYEFHWMSENPDQPDRQLVMWNNCSATIDVLVHYGYFSGRELRDYGVSDVDDLEFYNATITVIRDRVIQVVVPKVPEVNLRPIFTASFYKTRDRIPSAGIAQRIRDVERCYLTTLRYLVTNAAGASGPITEADYTRLSKYMSDEDIARLIPNTVYLADGEVGSTAPALRFYNIPSVMPQYMQVMEYFMGLADRVTNIPAALHGMAQGSGANRTFRGAAMLQGNAVKAIQAAGANIDRFVFTPMGQLLYNYNMVYSSDLSIKGDCRVITQGATGLLQREVDRQNSYEILQLVATAGQQLSMMPNGPAILSWALNNVMRNMGVPKDLLSSTTAVNPQVSGPTGGGMQPAQDSAMPGDMPEPTGAM